MKLQRIVPVLYVTDLPATIAFYTGVIGFRCDAEMAGWASLSHEEAEIMLSLPNAHLPLDKPQLTGSLYFRLGSIADLDRFWEQVKTRARVVYEIENFAYGMREFAIYDNNGYVLQFGVELE